MRLSISVGIVLAVDAIEERTNVMPLA